MRSILPHAVFIGFTGTPLLKKDKVILDLQYEARDVDQNIYSQEKIDKWFDSKTSGLTEYATYKLKQKLGTMQKVLSSQSRLGKIAVDIIYDMETKDRLKSDHGLFQAICRVNCLDGDSKEFGYIVDYKDLFKSLEKSVEDYTTEAFDDYDDEDIEGLLTNRLEKAKERLDTARESVKSLCEPCSTTKRNC